MRVSKELGRRIKALARGKLFRSVAFLDLGSRAAVDQALWRLVNTGKIKRIKGGVFVRPEKNAYVGEVLPGVEKVTSFLARQSGNKVGISGAEAARRFGFTTQMSSRSVFHTDGPSRKYRLGNQEVRLIHVAARKVALAGTPVGEALSALWYLGINEVSTGTIERIAERLPQEQFSILLKSQKLMPGWMRDTLNEYQREHQVA